jgi:thioester reductase-like protein
MYGITETTVHVTYKEITGEEINQNISNIGKPIPTLTTYIMDSAMRLLPIGVPGEICVGGEGVGRGYLGLPQLTKEKFVNNPYKPGERLYRSGDLARLLPTGEMEYLGRIDFQVKIRGFRIELGEIETCLMRHPKVDKAIVTARDDSAGTKYLCAYYTLKEKASTKEIKQHIEGHLPAYMVPSFFVALEEFPLTVNGKINAASLPDPATLNLNVTALEQPQTETEKYLIDVWKRMLGLKRIGVNDNFFESGGHSLLAVSTAFEIQKCYKCSTNEIFEYPTIKELAKHITPISDSIKDRIAKLKVLLPEVLKPDGTELQVALENYKKYNARYLYNDMQKSRNYRCVLLAGATGYLGVYILHGLLCSSDKKVICIIRADSDKQAFERLKEKTSYYFGDGFIDKYLPRLSVYAGDLALPDAAMSEAKAAEITKTVDCIINSASNVNHFGRYEEFFSGNVQTVRTLLSLAKKLKNCDVHHMSTLSVCMGDIPGKNHLIFTENDLDLGQNSDNNYIRTKLMAEQEIVEARKKGLNVSVYRIGNISVNSGNGKLQQNIETNAFFRQLQAFICLGAVPASYDEVEFSFVDSIAEAFLKLYEKESLINETFHLANTNVSKLSEILPCLYPEYSVNAMGFDEFIDFLCKAEENTEKFNCVKEIIQQRGWFAMTGLMQDGSLSRIVPCTVLFDKTSTILERCGFKWPEPEWKTLKQLMLYAAGADNTSNIKRSIAKKGNNI